MNKLFRILLGLPFALMPLTAHAQASAGACKYIGDGCGPENMLATLIPLAASFLITVAGGAAVLFVAVGAFLMLIAAGDEGRAAKGKMAVIYALVGLGIALLAQTIVAYLDSQFGDLVLSSNPVLDFIPLAVNAVMTLFNSVFALMVVFAGLRMVFGHGSTEEFGKARSVLVWALAGALVANFGRVLVENVIVVLAP